VGPYGAPNGLQRRRGSAIGARFREWRSVDLEGRILDVLDAAYARGAYEASGPAAMLEWRPDEPGRVFVHDARQPLSAQALARAWREQAAAA